MEIFWELEMSYKGEESWMSQDLLAHMCTCVYVCMCVTFRRRASDTSRVLHISHWWANITSWSSRSSTSHAVCSLSSTFTAQFNIAVNSAFTVENLRHASSTCRHYWPYAIPPSPRSQCHAVSGPDGGEACPRRVLQRLRVYMPGVTSRRAARDVCECCGTRLCRRSRIWHDIMWSKQFTHNRPTWWCWSAARQTWILGCT